MRSIFKWFVYASLIFLVYYIVRQGVLEVPQVHSLAILLTSFPVLIAGCWVGVLAWHRMLSKSDLSCSSTECLAGMGLSIFGKYVPGKVWVILGRAAYVAEKRRLPLATVSAASLNDQFIALWAGLLLGTIGLLWVGGLRVYGWLTLLSWIGISLLVFSPWFHRIAEALLKVVLRRDVEVPATRPRLTLQLLPWHLCYWLLWSVSFYLFVAALSPGMPALSVGLAFPLAGGLGVMAVIVPGGLGVREGIITGYLTLVGIPLTEAVTLSVASRFWFLIGEIVVFVAGVVADRRLKR